MPSVADLLTGRLKEGPFQQISGRVGSDEQSTSKALSQALPMLLGAMARNSSRSGGAKALLNPLDKDHDGSMAGDLSQSFSHAEEKPGGGILPESALLLNKLEVWGTFGSH